MNYYKKSPHNIYRTFCSNLLCGGFNMERNQKINCTVSSCKYNNTDNAECILKAIQVSPMEGCDTKKPDESMCASYENQNK